MGLFGNLFDGWHESGGYRFRHGVEVRVIGSFTRSDRFAGRVGRVVGLGKMIYVWADGESRKQRLFLIDLGGMTISTPGSDLELVEQEKPNLKW